MVEIIIAFALDLLVGDPPYALHPVRIIGRRVEATEKWLRAGISNPKLAGFIQVLVISVSTFSVVWFLTELAAQFAPLLGKAFTIYFLYSAISVKDLSLEARKVYTALRNHKIEAARENLSRIVGRDTKDLSEEEVIRATVETVAESFVDGVFSPLLFAAIGGAPLAMTYKAINTLDSMVGRRTPQYRKFGFVAAKLDEIVNWIPARISWFLIGLGAFVINGRGLEAMRVGLEEGAITLSPNGAVPEAAFAGALGIELGGTNTYGGEKIKTPKLGYPMNPLERSTIRNAVNLMKASAWASLFFALLVRTLSGVLYYR